MQSKNRVGYCKVCGKSFIKEHATVKYCSDECRNVSRKLQNRNKSSKWYHKNKHKLNEKQRWGLGSGYLGKHRQESFSKEERSILNEFVRLKIKPKR